MKLKEEAKIAAVIAGYVSESDHAKAVANARKIGLLRAAEMAEGEAEQQRGFAAEAERKCLRGSAASHTSAGQLMAAFAKRLRAEAEE